MMNDNNDVAGIVEISRLIEASSKQAECLLNILNHLSGDGHPVASIAGPASRLAKDVERIRSGLLAIRLECGFPDRIKKECRTSRSLEGRSTDVHYSRTKPTSEAVTLGRAANSVVNTISGRPK